MSSNPSDKRLKLIEIVLTLGGFLGVIIALQQSLLVAQVKTTFSLLVVLFMIFALFAYVSVAAPLDDKAIKLSVGGLSAVFSGLLAIALTVPVVSQSAGVVTLAIPYIGVLGAIGLYVVFVLVFAYLFYFLMMKAISTSFEKMAPLQAESLWLCSLNSSENVRRERRVSNLTRDILFVGTFLATGIQGLAEFIPHG